MREVKPVKIQEIKSRSVVFTFDATPDWDLNIHLILGDKYNYLIDTGLGSENMEPVKQHLQPGKPVIVINTHYHWDHVWGNVAFGGSAIISHSLCRQRLEERWDAMIRKNRQYISGDVQMCLPNLVFEDGLYFPDDGIRIFYTPGHTEDGISVFDEQDKVLNAGDNIGDDMGISCRSWNARRKFMPQRCGNI
jgi:glyoxylase-like metal-dependent hydrolase (beta-lactamase superfamily II)